MTCETEVFLPDAAATEAFGEWLGARLQAGQGLALIGEMGAGKTCLTRGVARGLAIEDPDAVASPTYLLVIEHPGPTPLIHIDAWLPDKTRGFLEDGGVDYLAECAGVVVVEWADRLADLLPAETLTLRLDATPEGGRRARLSGGDSFAWTLQAPGAGSPGQGES